MLGAALIERLGLHAVYVVSASAMAVAAWLVGRQSRSDGRLQADTQPVPA